MGQISCWNSENLETLIPIFAYILSSRTSIYRVSSKKNMDFSLLNNILGNNVVCVKTLIHNTPNANETTIFEWERARARVCVV